MFPRMIIQTGGKERASQKTAEVKIACPAIAGASPARLFIGTGSSSLQLPPDLLSTTTFFLHTSLGSIYHLTQYPASRQENAANNPRNLPPPPPPRPRIPPTQYAGKSHPPRPRLPTHLTSHIPPLTHLITHLSPSQPLLILPDPLPNPLLNIPHPRRRSRHPRPRIPIRFPLLLPIASPHLPTHPLHPRRRETRIILCWERSSGSRLGWVC
jgi:hypothetical protein